MLVRDNDHVFRPNGDFTNNGCLEGCRLYRHPFFVFKSIVVVVGYYIDDVIQIACSVGKFGWVCGVGIYKLVVKLYIGVKQRCPFYCGQVVAIVVGCVQHTNGNNGVFQLCDGVFDRFIVSRDGDVITGIVEMLVG